MTPPVRNIRLALAGRNTGRPEVPVPADTPRARDAVRARTMEFVVTHTWCLAAEEYYLYERALESEDGTREFFHDRAEQVSRLLGYEATSRLEPHFRPTDICAAETCQQDSEAVIRPGDEIIEADRHCYHRACVPSSILVGYDRYAVGADPERWLIRAFAELDAGILRPGADSWVQGNYGLYGRYHR